MKKILSLFFASVFALSLSAQVGYLIPYTADVNYGSIGNVYDYLPQENSGSVEESPERKSYEWFNGVYSNAAGKQFFTVKDIKDGALLSAGVPTVAALWINVDRVGYSLEDFDAMFNDDFKTAVANYVKAGGNLYLSKQATRLVTSIGRCSWWPHAFDNGDYGDGNDTWNMTDNFCANYNRHGHAMIKYVENYSDGWHFPLTSGEGTYRRTNNNSLWDDWGAYGISENGCDAYGDGDFKDKNIRIHKFETAQNCQILGGWGHTQGMDCAGFIEFFPNGDFKGTVVVMGLAAYQWGTSNTSVYNVKNLTKGVLDYLNARPCALDNVKSMEDKLAEEFFYPSNTTTFRTLHPDCEGLSAAYSLTSDPNNIARIQEGVIVGENTITQLQFKAAGTVTLHIVLTENREFKNWPKGTYEYDRAITFSYANPNAAQEAVEADLSSDGKKDDRFMLLHPNIRGLDSVSYTIDNNYGGSGGQALKVKDSEASDAATRLCFTHKGSVQLQIKMNETDWVEAWPMGEKDFTKVVTFSEFERPEGPTMNWPFEFFKGGIEPNSVITLPAQIEGLTPTYTVTGDATVEGNTLTVGNVTSGSFTVTASVTENDYKLAWPVGTYQFEKSLPVYAAEVGYLLPAAESIDHLKFSDDPDYQGQQPEYNAAKWFQDNYIATGQGRFVTVDELPTLKAKGIKALWVNIERVNIDNVNGLLTACLADDGLKTYIQAGGNVLLTKQATRLAFTMDRIGYAPEFNASGYVTDNFGAQRSVATRMGISADEILDMSEHRLFTDMLSWTDSKNVYLVGETCMKTYNYCSWENFFTDNQGTHANDNGNIQRLRDFETAWNATVFGIRGDIVDYCLSNIIEFNATGNWLGRILTIGSAAYQWGSANPTAELDNVKKLTANSLSYLLDEPLADEVYTRNGLTPGIYGTICFDYAVEAGHIEGAEIYELTSFNATNDGVILTQVDAMVAGRPYFFLATANELRLTYNGQRVAAGSYHGLVGHIGETTLHITPNVNNYILYNNELLLVDRDDIELPSYRAYINKYDEIPAYQASAPANVRRRVMSINRYQAPTGLETVEHSAQSGSYDILGRKVNNPQSAGFYIINGKKVIITQ